MSKITIIGAGSVGATIANDAVIMGIASEVVLIDVKKDKAYGEALDIYQGTRYCSPAIVRSGDYADAEGSDIVVITSGIARKPGQSRLDLAQANVDIIKQVMPQITLHAPDAVYVVVSNPVDILTYTIIKHSGLPESQILGSGTTLDSSRLRERLAEHVHLNPKNVHAYVFGEHGDTSMIPWSLTCIAGMPMAQYCTHICDRHNGCGKGELRDIEDDVRTAGAKVIQLKGATFYAIAMAVSRICECITRDTDSVLTVSTLTNGRYNLPQVALSLPAVVGAHGIKQVITPPLLPDEEQLLRKSADTLKALIDQLDI